MRQILGIAMVLLAGCKKERDPESYESIYFRPYLEMYVDGKIWASEIPKLSFSKPHFFISTRDSLSQELIIFRIIDSAFGLDTGRYLPSDEPNRNFEFYAEFDRGKEFFVAKSGELHVKLFESGNWKIEADFTLNMISEKGKMMKIDGGRIYSKRVVYRQGKEVKN